MDGVSESLLDRTRRVEWWTESVLVVNNKYMLTVVTELRLHEEASGGSVHPMDPLQTGLAVQEKPKRLYPVR
jgi:hypothetical protein